MAYLLCELDGLHKLGRRNFVFCCLAYRVFGRERLRALFSEVTQMLVGWGYRKRLAGTFVPRVLCELLVTNRSPKLEDLTLELLQTVERRRVSATSTWCLSVPSKVLASRGIISAPIMRMDKPKRANPELTAGVPEKWVQAAKYWYENGTRCSRLRRADYYFVLAVGRWLAAEHPTIRSPEQWDWNLAVQCLTMITNMRCGDWRAPGVAPWGWRKHYSRPLKAATKMQNYTAVRTFFGDLQEWLGHRLPSSTQRYAKITPTKLMKSYSDAGYFGRNLRAIEVLIDQEKVRAGVGAEEAWKFYDLGHGYCTYDFFDECPHRMACAKCSFYIPKESTAAALLVGKSNLLRMRQEIPLSEAELAALDDGVSALESLLSRLADVPTPAGQTPVQLRAESLVQIDAMQRRTEA